MHNMFTMPRNMKKLTTFLFSVFAIIPFSVRAEMDVRVTVSCKDTGKDLAAKKAIFLITPFSSGALAGFKNDNLNLSPAGGKFELKSTDKRQQAYFINSYAKIIFSQPEQNPESKITLQVLKLDGTALAEVDLVKNEANGTYSGLGKLTLKDKDDKKAYGTDGERNLRCTSPALLSKWVTEFKANSLLYYGVDGLGDNGGAPDNGEFQYRIYLGTNSMEALPTSSQLYPYLPENLISKFGSALEVVQSGFIEGTFEGELIRQDKEDPEITKQDVAFAKDHLYSVKIQEQLEASLKKGDKIAEHLHVLAKEPVAFGEYSFKEKSSDLKKELGLDKSDYERAKKLRIFAMQSGGVLIAIFDAEGNVFRVIKKKVKLK